MIWKLNDFPDLFPIPDYISDEDPNPEHKDPDVEPTQNVQGAQRVVSVTLTPVFVQSASVMTVLFPVMNHV